MATDPSGIFTLPPSTWVETGDTVLPEQHNPAMREIEQGMSDRLMRDGRAPMTGALRMGDNKITGLADGEARSDAAAIGQVEDKITSAFKAWLTSVNTLSLAANEMVYASGANTAAKTALTSYARGLLAAADAAAARGTLGITKALIDGLGINASTVGGIAPGQIARTDTGNDFAGQVGALASLNVTAAPGGNGNTHVWFRNAAGDVRGLVYRDASTGTLRLRTYTSDTTYEEALLDAAGIFRAPAFQGDGSRLTGIPMAFGAGWTLRNVTGSRSLGTTYTNNTGHPMEVAIIVRSGSNDVSGSFTINGSLVSQAIGRPTGVTNIVTFTNIVGPGDTYRAEAGPGALHRWHERARL